MGGLVILEKSNCVPAVVLQSKARVEPNLLTMIGPAANMNNYRKEVVDIISIWAIISRVSQLQLEGKHHPVHQFPHPAG